MNVNEPGTIHHYVVVLVQLTERLWNTRKAKEVKKKIKKRDFFFFSLGNVQRCHRCCILTSRPKLSHN